MREPRRCSRCRRREPDVVIVTLLGGEHVCARCLDTPPPDHPTRGPVDVDLDDDATPIAEAA